MQLSPTILLAILFAPLVAFVIQILFGYRLFGSQGGSNRLRGAIIPILGVLTSFVLVLITIVPYLFSPIEPYVLPEHGNGALWMDFGSLQLRIGLLVDNTTKVILFMVTLVCLMIHLFAAEYMKVRDGEPEPRYTRFFAYLALFTFAMILLTLSDNLLTLFVGWELMGLCSYLLIGFYYEKRSAQSASMKAFMTTRVGDVLLFLALAMIWTAVGSLRFADVHEAIRLGRFTGGLLTVAGLLALGGAIGKSAQFPLHTWLPDAMEGPTPVSALIHAATMVAAGVYLAARLLQMGVLDSSALLFIAYIGGFTAVFAASIAFVQTDIKRVLAYSTISQLGYMMLAVGVQNYTAAIFHLLTHAFFKSCLFLGSGSVIHAMHDGLHHVDSHADAQDMRNMGGLRRRMPATFWTFLIATLALSGSPFTAGFLSKDAILGGSLAYAMKNPQHALLPIAGFIAALMTAFYMFRAVIMSFFGKPAEHADAHERDQVKAAHAHVHESPALMWVPLTVLAFFATWIFWSVNPLTEGWIGEAATPQDAWITAAELDEGAVTSDRFIAETGVEAQGATSEHDAAEADEEIEHRAHRYGMTLSLIMATVGVLLAILFYGTRTFSSGRYARSSFARVLVAKYGFDEFYDWALVKNVLRISNLSGLADSRIVDGAVNGVGTAFVGARYSFTWLNGAIDRYVVDGAVNGVASLLRGIGASFRRVQSGVVQSYLLVVFTGLVILIFIVAVGLR